jgi:hypothetical protein
MTTHPAMARCLSGSFFASKQIPVLPQPSYSPDLALCDFFLFPNMKNRLGAATEVLNGLTEEFLQRCFLENGPAGSGVCLPKETTSKETTFNYR